jgi:hypothetical protein
LIFAYARYNAIRRHFRLRAIIFISWWLLPVEYALKPSH